jgi:hypothetical protein
LDKRLGRWNNGLQSRIVDSDLALIPLRLQGSDQVEISLALFIPHFLIYQRRHPLQVGESEDT